MTLNISPMPLSSTLTYTGVQSLRAVAALMVVVYHAIEIWNLKSGQSPIIWPNGSAGVDLFFVISGFVMTVSSRHMSGWRDARHFVFLRLSRIVPLYWIFSAAKIVAVLALPALVLRAHLSSGYVGASFLFLPLHDAAGDFKPVLAVGWTLTFEMLFYALFAIALAIRVPVALFMLPALLVLSLAPHAPGSVIGELCNPIILEFGFGIAVALLLQRGVKLHPAVLGIVLAAAFAVMATMHPEFLGGRVLVWGVPAGIIVATTVALEPVFTGKMPKFMLKLGDASYSVYLTHGFVVPMLAILLPHVPHSTPMAALWVSAVLLSSGIAGYAAHVVLEKPLMGWIKSQRARSNKNVIEPSRNLLTTVAGRPQSDLPR